jgi:hypothetical protein
MNEQAVTALLTTVVGDKLSVVTGVIDAAFPGMTTKLVGTLVTALVGAVKDAINAGYIAPVVSTTHELTFSEEVKS